MGHEAIHGPKSDLVDSLRYVHYKFKTRVMSLLLLAQSYGSYYGLG